MYLFYWCIFLSDTVACIYGILSVLIPKLMMRRLQPKKRDSFLIMFLYFISLLIQQLLVC